MSHPSGDQNAGCRRDVETLAHSDPPGGKSTKASVIGRRTRLELVYSCDLAYMGTIEKWRPHFRVSRLGFIDVRCWPEETTTAVNRFSQLKQGPHEIYGEKTSSPLSLASIPPGHW